VQTSSWTARCSRQLHVHIWLLTQRGREADLRDLSVRTVQRTSLDGIMVVVERLAKVWLCWI
jgi:hypothetical protein